jgi:hypothetical protein
MYAKRRKEIMDKVEAWVKSKDLVTRGNSMLGKCIDLTEKTVSEEIFKEIDYWLSCGDMALLADKKYLKLKKKFMVD